MQQINLELPKIELPESVRALLEKTIFDAEEELNTEYLNKYLFYMPEVVRIFGLALVMLKAQKRQLERRIKRIENYEAKVIEGEILMEIMDEVDSHKYRNEQMRTAKVMLDPRYAEIMDELEYIQKVVGDLDYEIDKIYEDISKHTAWNKNLQIIGNLRIAELRR